MPYRLVAIRPKMAVAPIPIGAAASSKLLVLFVLPGCSALAGTLFFRSVKFAGVNRLAQGIRQEIPPGGDPSQLFPLIQKPLNLYKYHRCQNCSSAPSRFFVKSGDSLLAIQLYASLHIDCGDAKVSADFRLFRPAIYIELTANHAKASLVVNPMAKNREMAMKIGDVVPLTVKTEVGIKERHPLGKKR
jgi:hypothetical protein